MAKFNTKSILNQGTFCDFSLAPKRKIYKTSMKHLKIHKFPFKSVIALARVQNVPENSAKSSLTWLHFKTDHWLRREENKVEFFKGRFLDDFSLPFLHKNKAEHSSELSFHFLSFNGVFLTLQCRTLVLKHLHGDPSAAILLKMDIRH